MKHFFAYMARMKYIRRWSLMKNSTAENVQEHTTQTAMIAHCLALISNRLLIAVAISTSVSEKPR